MNFSIPLLALLAANRLGDSAADAGRIALMSMLIRPPVLGLLIALSIARDTKPAEILKDPAVKLALEELTGKDARRMRQLEDAVSVLQRAVDNLRAALTVSEPARRKGSARKARAAVRTRAAPR